MSAPTADAAAQADVSSQQRPSPWLAISGVLLLVTLLAAVFVQARQYAMLNLTVVAQDDYLALSLYQMETEVLRLREQLKTDDRRAGGAAAGAGDDSGSGAGTLNLQAVQLRYDIFVSRLSLLNTQHAQRVLSASEVSAGVLRELDNFTRRADLYLGPDRLAPLSPEAARALHAQLLALDAPIHRMLLDAAHHVAAQMSEREEQVRRHNRVGLGLTSFLVAMVLLFALVAMRQMRQLEQRRLVLQTLADELRDARIDAEAASTAKSDFLADMSHELRTPLHGLLGMLSLVRDAPQDKRATQWLATADESATHLLSLLDDMLDLSKLSAGTMALTPRAVHLGSMVAEVQALLQPSASAKGLVLQTELSPTLPQHVWLDPTRVKQVLFNLLGNALKFSDSGLVMLRCRPVTGGNAQPMLEFDVADTGIGMDAETLTRLFQRFSRADTLRARGQDGTGLGLAISRNLAGLMRGDIVVRSTPGAGSVFTFRCPLRPAPEPEAELAAQHSTAQAMALQVLVAEDHPVNRLFMAALLDRLGHHARLVDNGLAALSAVQQQPFDLVLMDVHMPVMDGVAATRAIRALPGAAGQTCIVALTADVFDDTLQRCLAAGAVEVVTKPVSLAGLRALIARHFGVVAGAVTAAAAHPEVPLQVPSPVAAQVQPQIPAQVQAPATAADPGRLLDAQAVAAVRELLAEDQLPALYRDFFSQARAAVQAMREAMRQADTAQLVARAHAVKGAALNLGLPALAEAAAQLNRDASHLPAAELALAVQRFEELTEASERLCRRESLV